MNEQLIVKNFGPIKDATVDFKKVTVFIGPTGGGKSTLAKLAAVFRERDFLFNLKPSGRYTLFESLLDNYAILNFRTSKTEIKWNSDNSTYTVKPKSFVIDKNKYIELDNNLTRSLKDFDDFHNDGVSIFNPLNNINFLEDFQVSLNQESNSAKFRFAEVISNFFTNPTYIPSERVFASAIEGAGYSLRRAKIAIPNSLENFLGLFEIARNNNNTFTIPFFNINYVYYKGENLLDIGKKHYINLTESASGIQSILPLMLVVEDLSKYINAHSFIIEEPEINLYPTAQQGLTSWLIDKCTVGENDLIITTHSPYILSHLNLLLYAYQVAEKHPDRADEVAQIVPRESWINPKDFACYQVENGGVQSLVNEDLGLIDDNELDNLSGDAADAFDNLIRLSKSVTVK